MPDKLQGTTLLIVGSKDRDRLESSYANAFARLGWNVHRWDPIESFSRVVRGGRLGLFLSNYVPVEPWIRRANRELVIQALTVQPDLIITTTHTVLRAGALAQIRAATRAKLVNIWPDTLVNWDTNLTANAAVYDLVATYSQSTVALIQQLGARRVLWVPLAADPQLHPLLSASPADAAQYGADITFIGGWRPEREAVLARLTDFDLKIWGPEWDRRCRHNRALLRAWQGRPLFGDHFARAVINSRINLNIIDPTNYPAANMRFFEIMAAGGLQLCSPCPEFEAEFQDGRHLFYYRNEAELPQLIDRLLHADEKREQVARCGHELTLSHHTYTHRACQILAQLEAAKADEP